MTNTLHRRGAREELERDYVLKCSLLDGKQEGAAGKRKAFVDIARKHGPIAVRIPDGSVPEVHEFVFDNAAAVKGALADLKSADLGVSVIVSGPIDQVRSCCREAGLSLHTVEHSLGIMGRRERLPAADIVDIGSLCGHGMVSHNLIGKMVEMVKTRRLSTAKAVAYLAKPCTCGAFNPKRAEEILERLRVRG
jgi:hypothetical protein